MSRIMKLLTCLILMLSASAGVALGQSDVVSTGGSGAGAGGIVDFSFGQVFDSYFQNSDNSVTEGVQQTYCSTTRDTIRATVCEGGTALIPGFDISQSTTNTPGEYSFLYSGINRGGCDSLVTLLLIVRPHSEFIETVSACDSYVWHGNTYSSSTNMPTYQYQDRYGCDSIVRLHLTINRTTYSTVEEQGEDNFFYNGTTYALSGEYHDTLVNRAGCDSIVTLKLCLMNPLPHIVSYNKQVVMVNHYPDGVGSERVDYSGYQWYHNDELMLGANEDHYSEPGYAQLSGVYYVKVPNKEKKCLVRSNIIDMINVQDIEAPEVDDFSFEINPNPISSGSQLNVVISLGSQVSLSDLRLIVYDLHGRKVYEKDRLEETVFRIGTDWSSGHYAVELINRNNIRKVKKLIVIR